MIPYHLDSPHLSKLMTLEELEKKITSIDLEYTQRINQESNAYLANNLIKELNEKIEPYLDEYRNRSRRVRG